MTTNRDTDELLAVSIPTLRRANNVLLEIGIALGWIGVYSEIPRDPALRHLAKDYLKLRREQLTKLVPVAIEELRNVLAELEIAQELLGSAPPPTLPLSDEQRSRQPVHLEPDELTPQGELYRRENKQ